MKKTISIVFVLLIISCSEIKHPPGVLVEAQPIQTNITYEKIWEKDGYNFKALAEFELEGKVLGKERYRFDKESDIAPYDLALGWGRMSDQSIVDKFNLNLLPLFLLSISLVFPSCKLE